MVCVAVKEGGFDPALADEIAREHPLTNTEGATHPLPATAPAHYVSTSSKDTGGAAHYISTSSEGTLPICLVIISAYSPLQ